MINKRISLDNSKKRIAIIPARGGSKRIPNKNIRDFCGKPMIQHILETATSTKLFDTIHVSTESLKIKEVVNKIGYKIEFMRPDHLADDHTTLAPVLKYVINEYKSLGEEYEEIWLLMACNPLLTADDLINASLILSSKNSNEYPLIAIQEFAAPIEWAYKLNESNNIIEPLHPKKLSIRSQDLESCYYDSGAFAVYTPDIIKKPSKEITMSKYIGFLLKKYSSVDIDNIDDWRLAESIYLARH